MGWDRILGFCWGGEDFRRQGITSICLPIPSCSGVVLSIYKAKSSLAAAFAESYVESMPLP